MEDAFRKELGVTLEKQPFVLPHSSSTILNQHRPQIEPLSSYCWHPRLSVDSVASFRNPRQRHRQLAVDWNLAEESFGRRLLGGWQPAIGA